MWFRFHEWEVVDVAGVDDAVAVGDAVAVAVCRRLAEPGAVGACPVVPAEERSADDVGPGSLRGVPVVSGLRNDLGVAGVVEGVVVDAVEVGLEDEEPYPGAVADPVARQVVFVGS